MKKIKLAMLLTIVSFGMMLLLTSCGGKGGSDEPLPNPLPVLRCNEATEITTTSATVKIDVVSSSSAFTERGVYLNGAKIVSDATGTASYTMTFGLLTPGTAYKVKAYAVVPEGTAYSNEIPFTTKEALVNITDVEGNSYPIVKIGDQFWTAEDSRCKKYRDGTPIANITVGTQWVATLGGAWCLYANDAKFPSVLYNWYAISNAKGIAPLGWHIPTQAEWEKLISYLGTNNGDKLKETGRLHWLGANATATNSSGFTAIPTGYRDGFGDFTRGGYEARWWSYKSNSPYSTKLTYDGSGITLSDCTVADGNALRFVKD